MSTWKDKVFPHTVELAQDISNYAITARTYYGALLKPIDDLLDDPDNAAAKTMLKSICDKRAKRCSSLAAVVFSLVVATSLGWSCARAVAADKQTIDFSPGKADELFALPREMWSNINRFAFLVCFDELGVKTTLSARVRELSGYSDLHANCQVWGERTFPTLQTLAVELSKGEIKALLLQVQGAFVNLRKNPGGGRTEFDQAANTLNQKLVTLTELSGRVNQESMAFYKASNLVIAAYKKRNLPDAVWVNIGPKLDDVGLAMGSMVGRWNILTSNLAYLRKTLELPQAGAGIPELYDLDIEVGLNAWDEITRRAKLFSADFPAQRKYLSGQNYYEECPLSEERWYVMKNSFLDGKGYVLTAQRPGPIPSGPSHAAKLLMKPQQKQAEAIHYYKDSYDHAWSQQWRFHRLRNGWWSIESRIRNDVGYPTYGFLLDAAPNVERLLLHSGYSYPPTNFWWRCLATTTQGAGWFRLVNASIGELQSLDTFNDAGRFFPGFMGSSTQKNYSGQYWKFEAAER